MRKAAKAKRPARFPRARRWLLIAAAALIVGVPSWVVYRVGARLRAAVAAADRDDPNWRLPDLLAARADVPDADNAAVRAAAAAAGLPDPWPPAPTPEEAAGGLALKAAFDRASRAEGPDRLDDETLAPLRAEMAARADVLAVAREMAGLARGRLDVVIAPNILDTKYEDVNAVRRVARLLQADAIVAAYDGRADDALADCRAMLGAGRSVGDAPGLIPQFTRGTIDRSAVQAILATLAWSEPSAEALAATRRDILAALVEPIERHALRGERALTFELLERFKVDAHFFSDGKLDGRTFTRLMAPAWYPFLTWQQALMLEWANEQAAIIERPTPQWLPAIDEWRDRLEALEASRFGSRAGALALLLAPTRDNAFESWLSRRAYLGAAAVVLAAERHRLATGKWPATDAEIDPDILPDSPLDPYTGEPFRALHIDGRLRVYSLGANLKDERGAFDSASWKDTMLPDDVGAFAYDPELRGRPAEAADEPGAANP